MKKWNVLFFQKRKMISMGGNTLTEIIDRVMRMIATDNVYVLYNWTGRTPSNDSKLSFEKLQAFYDTLKVTYILGR